MATEFDHNKTITQAARSILKPHGLFQKGSSRTWIDDNGWYLTVVEFQPSNWGKGSYLNVGINFLWRQQDYLSFDFGSREHSFVSAEDLTSFCSKAADLSQIALDIVMKYRSFRDLRFACEQILNNNAGIPSHLLYHKMMVCGLIEDPRVVNHYNALWDQIRFSEFPFESVYRQELEEQIDPIIFDTAQFKAYILTKIQRQREFWRSKSSMKRLAETFGDCHASVRTGSQ